MKKLILAIGLVLAVSTAQVWAAGDQETDTGVINVTMDVERYADIITTPAMSINYDPFDGTTASGTSTVTYTINYPGNLSGVFAGIGFPGTKEVTVGGDVEDKDVDEAVGASIVVGLNVSGLSSTISSEADYTGTITLTLGPRL